MGSSFDDTTQQQNQSGTANSTASTGPWGPSQGNLQQLLSQLSTQYGSTTPTDTESGALNNLESSTGYGAGFLPYMTNVTNNAFTGGPDRRGNAVNNYDVLNKQLTPTIGGNYLDPNSNPISKDFLMPTAQGKYLDPSTNPFFNDTTNTIARDTEERLRGLYAGSGRSAPGAGNYGYNAGKGIAEATAPIFANQYNQERARQEGAISQLNTNYGTERGRQEQAFRDLNSAGNNEVGLLSGLDQQMLNNQKSGFDLARQTQDFASKPYQDILAAEAYKRNIPLSTLASLVGLTTPIAGLGKEGTTSTQSTGSGKSVTDPSFLQDITSIGNLFKK